MGPVLFFFHPPPLGPATQLRPARTLFLRSMAAVGWRGARGAEGWCVRESARARTLSSGARGGPHRVWRVEVGPTAPARRSHFALFFFFARAAARPRRERKKERAGGPPARARATPEPCARGHPATHHGLSRRCPAHHPHPRRTVRGDGAGLLVSARRRAHLFAAAGRGGGRRPARPAARVVPPGGSRPGGGGGRLFGRARCEGN